MAHLVYQNHTIISAAVYDDVTGKWRLTASISWPEGPSRRLHFITDRPERFSRIEDAEKAAIEAAKNWVDSKARKPLRANLPTRSSPSYHGAG
jgi:hypothetical protein